VPRTNAGSRRFDENVVARRIGWELADREWTYQELATRMATVSCPMDQSAIHKIIKKGRRITVNELVAFSEVLGVPINELLGPLETELGRRQDELLKALDKHRKAYVSATNPMVETINEIAKFMLKTGYFSPRLLNALADQERSMVNLVDVALEAEDALRGADLGEFPVPEHSGLSAPPP
jgi:transcriptional regulator with XRE-family HTH domain